MRRRQSALVFLDKMTRGEYLFTEVSPDGGAVGKVGSSDAEDAGDDNMNNYNNVNNLDPRRKGQEVSDS